MPSTPRQRPAAAEQHHEAALRERAVDEARLVGALDAARHLDLAVVLVGPHEGHRREGRAAGLAREQRLPPRGRPARSRWSSARCASTRRTARSASAPRRPPPRRRARAWCGSVASHTTPSASSRPEPSSQRVAGAAPIPTTTTSAGTRVPSASSTRLDAPRADEARDLRAEPQVHALLAVDLADVGAELRAEPALERRGERLDHASPRARARGRSRPPPCR